MQKFLSVSIIACFIFYWTITFLFTMPENYFRINFFYADSFFQSALFQRWTFFAPPPTHNDRLYYVVRDKNTEKVTYTLEALEYLTARKQEKAPFNQEETVMDYIISNSINGIKDSYRDQMNMIKYNKPDSSQSYVIKAALDEILKDENVSDDFNTLINYGRIICTKNNTKTDNSEFKIVITQKPIPKFKDRMKRDSANSELLVLQTPYMPL